MNACLECCGWGGRFQGAGSESSERSRLLYDDPYRPQYGANGQNLHRVIQQQPDPEVLRQEREQMEAICHSMSDQVVDVFNIAPPGQHHRILTRDQAKTMLARNGIDPASLSEAKIAAFAQQTFEGQQKAIQLYHSVLEKKRPQAPLVRADSRWRGTDEELVYKTVKRSRRDPTSIELGQNESEAAKAALG